MLYQCMWAEENNQQQQKLTTICLFMLAKCLNIIMMNAIAEWICDYFHNDL